MNMIYENYPGPPYHDPLGGCKRKRIPPPPADNAQRAGQTGQLVPHCFDLLFAAKWIMSSGVLRGLRKILTGGAP
jgi:hypothetical protein